MCANVCFQLYLGSWGARKSVGTVWLCLLAYITCHETEAIEVTAFICETSITFSYWLWSLAVLLGFSLVMRRFSVWMHTGDWQKHIVHGRCDTIHLPGFVAFSIYLVSLTDTLCALCCTDGQCIHMFSSLSVDGLSRQALTVTNVLCLLVCWADSYIRCPLFRFHFWRKNIVIHLDKIIFLDFQNGELV